MKTIERIAVALLLAALMLAACQTQNKPVVSTSVSTPISTPIRTPITKVTPVTSCHSAMSANEISLYTGPGNVDFPLVQVVPVGTKFSLLGRYGDFIKVQAQTQDGLQEGYIWQKAISNIPADLPILTQAQVPWANRNLILKSSSYSVVAQFGVYENDFVFGSPSPSSLPVRVQMDLSVETYPADADVANGVALTDYRSGQSELVKAVSLVKRKDGWLVVYQKGGSTPIQQQVWKGTDIHGQFTFELASHNSVAVVTTPDGKSVSVPLGESVFPDNTELRLAVQVAPQSKITFQNLSIAQPASGIYHSPADMNGLRTLAEARGIDFGISPDSWTDSLQIDQILKENSNLLNWHIWWQSTQTNYAYLDPQLPLIFFAKNNGMKVRISPLIWGFDVAKEYKDANLSKDEITKVLTDRINGIMQRFSYADEWVVVNEAITSDGKTAGYDQNVWYRAMGTGYVDAAFQLARKNAPKAVLIYNDNGIEGPGPKTDAVYQMLKDLKVKGTPVDGVGMEFHLDAANAPSKTDMVATMQRFGSLGLGVYITELDVNVLHLTGSAEEKASKQAQIYSDVVQACLESGVCKSINVWGMSDKNSWLVQPQWQFKGGGETPLIFDDQYQPKLAYTAIQQALRPVNLGRPVKP